MGNIVFWTFVNNLNVRIYKNSFFNTKCGAALFRTEFLFCADSKRHFFLEPNNMKADSCLFYVCKYCNSLFFLLNNTWTAVLMGKMYILRSTKHWGLYCLEQILKTVAAKSTSLFAFVNVPFATLLWLILLLASINAQ